jgi:molybdopterin-guanine dinucleotide biosynthesis protein B
VTPPLFGIAGWKNSGKTTLVTKLVAHFTERGLRVAAIKHAHHNFDVDHEGRDSFRYRQGGAATVIVSSAKRVAIMKELREEPEPSLRQLVQYAGQADLIIVEGFKSERHPKLEIRRREATSQTPLAPNDPTILAVAADFETSAGGLPIFHIDAVEEIADFIAKAVSLTMRKR